MAAQHDPSPRTRWLYSAGRRFRYSPQTHEFQELHEGTAFEDVGWITHPPVSKHWAPPKVKPVRRAVKFPEQMPDFIQIP